MRILITGENSYIGTMFEQWVKEKNPEWLIDTICVKDSSWRQISFNQYDSVLHVAGIAHVSTDPKMEELYYKVNRDLAIEVAQKAKDDQVRQFIFMSSMIIYGEDEGVGISNVITKDTTPKPLNFYGDSKLQADLAIQKMSDEKFKTAIIRTPMVYGPNSKGNFPKLIKLAKFTPIFPSLENKRSMIYIDNLTEFIRLLVLNQSSGIFFPQNTDYVGTREIVTIAGECMNRKIYSIDLFNPLLTLMSKKMSIINKVLGNKIYDKEISKHFDQEYCVVDFKDSIKRSIYN